MSTPEPIAVLLCKVKADVGAVAKKDRNDQQKFLFRGVDAVVNAVSPALITHGITVVPRVLSERREVVNTSSGKSMNYVAVNIEYTYYGPAGDSIVGSALGAAFDSGDKAEPKAMSVAYRVFLLQSLSLPTDEPDVDSESHEMGRAQPKAPANDPAAEEWLDRIRTAMNTSMEELVTVGVQLQEAHAMNLMWDGVSLGKRLEQAQTYRAAQDSKQ